jgi:hypothetical protein
VPMLSHHIAPLPSWTHTTSSNPSSLSATRCSELSRRRCCKWISLFPSSRCRRKQARELQRGGRRSCKMSVLLL